MGPFKDIFMDIDDGSSELEDAIEVYADSVKIALEMAALEYNADIHMLDYEVLEKGTKGLFGFGRLPYRVLVRKLEMSSQSVEDLSALEEKLMGEMLEPELDKNRDGEFRIRTIKSGTFLKVLPPQGNGKPVDIMKVNDRLFSMNLTDVDMALVQKTVDAASGEPVRLAEWVPNPDHDGSMRVEISEDEMTVYVHFTPPRYAGCHMETTEVIDSMKSKGVVTGIDTEKIENYLDMMKYNQPLVAARGQEPRHGNDAYIDYKVRTDKDNVKFKQDEQGNIDFKDRDLLENVVVGQVLAIKVPAEKGIPGRTVTNTPIPANSGKDVKVHYGKGTILSEDGTELTAEINGQVVFTGNKISVEPVYTVSGDVGVQTGNIVFLGSVIITGSVQDGHSVKAAGNIEVKGTVQKANLEAEGDIIIRQGIAGRDGARIESTGGSVYAKFIQSATVVAQNDIIVPEGVLHSFIDAGARVISIGRRARIVGGRIRAGDEVNARFIGAEVSTKTEVRVGINPKILQQISELDEQKTKFQEEIDGMEKNIVTLESQKKSKKLNAEKEKMLKDMLSRKEKLGKRIEELNQDLEELNSYIDTQEHAGKICAEKTAFSGVDIYVVQEFFPLKDPYNSVTFNLEGGQINIAEYKAPDLSETDQKVRTVVRR